MSCWTPWIGPADTRDVRNNVRDVMIALLFMVVYGLDVYKIVDCVWGDNYCSRISRILFGNWKSL